MSNETVIVKLLDKDYQVACPAGQRDALEESANYLDKQMRNIRSNGKVIGLERIAVMAALNISNELLQNGEPNTDISPKAAKSPSSKQLKGLNDKLDEALQEFALRRIRRDTGLAFCAWQLVTSMIVAAIFFGTIRLRTPYDPYAIVLALEAWAVLVPWTLVRIRRARAIP